MGAEPKRRGAPYSEGLGRFREALLAGLVGDAADFDAEAEDDLGAADGGAGREAVLEIGRVDFVHLGVVIDVLEVDGGVDDVVEAVPVLLEHAADVFHDLAGFGFDGIADVLAVGGSGDLSADVEGWAGFFAGAEREGAEGDGFLGPSDGSDGGENTEGEREEGSGFHAGR